VEQQPAWRSAPYHVPHPQAQLCCSLQQHSRRLAGGAAPLQGSSRVGGERRRGGPAGGRRAQVQVGGGAACIQAGTYLGSCRGGCGGWVPRAGAVTAAQVQVVVRVAVMVQ
jgi:hypothetical protein